MKAKKVLKRIAKIEALISEVSERSSPSAPQIQELLREAKNAISRAKAAVSLEASYGTAKNPSARSTKQPSKVRPEPTKPKRKLSAAAVKLVPAVAKKTAVKKVAAKKATPVKAAKAPARKKAKKAPSKKTAVNAPAKKAVRVVQAAKTPAPPTTEAATVTTPEQVAPEAPV